MSTQQFVFHHFFYSSFGKRGFQKKPSFACGLKAITTEKHPHAAHSP